MMSFKSRLIAGVFSRSVSVNVEAGPEPPDIALIGAPVTTICSMFEIDSSDAFTG